MLFVDQVKKTGERIGNTRFVEKSSRHGESASHLLNFTYAPLRSQEDGGRRASGGQWRGGHSRKQPVHTKEQFLQAHCQFVVKRPVSDGVYQQHLVDADKMVEWEDIEQVVSWRSLYASLL